MTTNYLTLIEEKVDKRGAFYLNKYICVCGRIKLARPYLVIKGKIKSCGCMTSELCKIANLKHGLSRHPLYAIWISMIRRCEDENAINYKDYGGRGVKVCEEWKNNVTNFYNWAIANGWREGLDIDKDIKGDGLLYSPITCSFITHKQNANAKRKQNYIEFNGEVKTISQWADIYGLHQRTLRNRIIRGMNIALALKMPAQKHGGHKKHKKVINYSFGYIN